MLPILPFRSPAPRGEPATLPSRYQGCALRQAFDMLNARRRQLKERQESAQRAASLLLLPQRAASASSFLRCQSAITDAT
jgi:hypothetical protein